MPTGGCWLCVAAALVLRIFVVQACHILQLSSEGFGGNFLHLLHAVAIYEGSGGGAFLIDHSRFPYRCDDSNVGGITDFFNHTGLRPWSRERQKDVEDEEKQECKWLDFLSLDHQVIYFARYIASHRNSVSICQDKGHPCSHICKIDVRQPRDTAGGSLGCDLG